MINEFFQDTVEPQFFEIISQDENPHLDAAYAQNIHNPEHENLDDMMAKMPDVFHEFFELDAA